MSRICGGTSIRPCAGGKAVVRVASVGGGRSFKVEGSGSRVNPNDDAASGLKGLDKAEMCSRGFTLD
jgi:hypothetical protein